MDEKLIEALDNCLTRIASGATIGECLTRYPQLAGELRPLLEAGARTQSLGAQVRVPVAAQRAAQARFLAAAAQAREAGAPARSAGPFESLRRISLASLSVLVALILGGIGLVAASAPSLPGDHLYGVKRAVENAQLGFEPDPVLRSQAASRQNETRLAEVQALLKSRRVAEVDFGGLLTEMAGEDWTVAGLPVRVPAGATVDGLPSPGLFVLIEGQTQPAAGLVLASRVQVAGVRLQGEIEAKSTGEWRVAGQSILVTDDTQFKDNFGVGDRVEVNARRFEDGRLLALAVYGLADVPTPTPVEPTPAVPTRPAPTRTPTPRPTSTPTAKRNNTSTPPVPTATGPAATPSSPPTLEEVEFEGSVEAIAADAWTIAGVLVRIDSQTRIEDNPQVGGRVRVQGVRQPDGSVLASEIKSLQGTSGPGGGDDSGVGSSSGSTGDDGNSGSDTESGGNDDNSGPGDSSGGGDADDGSGQDEGG